MQRHSATAQCFRAPRGICVQETPDKGKCPADPESITPLRGRKPTPPSISLCLKLYRRIGKQIAEAVGVRAEYGKGLLQYLSNRLLTDFSLGFTVRNLRAMRQFYRCFSNRHTLCADLSWSHYRLIMKV
jgi:hypothetical protein